MSQDLLLALDIGSSSVRCTAYTLSEAPKALEWSASQAKRNIVKDEGLAHADEVVELVESVVDQCIRHLRSKQEGYCVKAVGLACFCMNLVGVDDAGNAVTPVFTYANIQPHTAEAATRLRTLLGAGVAEAYQRTGTPVHPSYAGPQLLHLVTEQSQVAARVHTWQTLPSLLLARWTGAASVPISYSQASWTGLLEFRELRWDQGLVSVLESQGFNPSSLPPLADHDDFEGRVTGAALERWPELKEARLMLGVGDGVAANIGSGCKGTDMLAVTVGTSAAARVVIDSQALGGKGEGGGAQRPEGAHADPEFQVPRGLWCYRVDRRRLLLGGALSDGGSVYEWLCDTLGMCQDQSLRDAMMEKVASSPPAGHGLVVLPFLSGERAPGWNDAATGAILGLRRHTQPHDVMRAGLEGVSYRLGEIVTLMGDHLEDGAAVMASGTALQRSQAWRQILADVLNRPVYNSREGEATSRGVACLVAQAILEVKDSDLQSQDTRADFREKDITQPIAEAHQLHMRAKVGQDQAYKHLYLPQN